MTARRRTVDALMLTPGAGADRNHQTLCAVEDAVAPLPVARVDFPYRIEGRKAPDRAPKLVAHIKAEASELAASTGARPDRIAYGGRSMGGRICSLAVAEGLPARALVLLSYPLHPPGKPDRLRTEHFPALDVPVLFISGSKDAFGTQAEFEHETAAIPGPVTFHWIDQAGHDPKGHDGTIAALVATWLHTIK